ncbi:MAG TPA: N-acetyl-gamma-glutamyl-phosphate reductase [Steroidobacteraceae bacterium]|nr:N-acetyl-gamma-glutamyl-phosphate reductase [Steroidobacteraceae bacterium]
MSAPIPTIVLGGTGYVAGELLRLIAGHPQLKLAGILSDSQPGEPVAKSFGHLSSAYPDTKFSSIEQIEQLIATLPRSAVFSAAPHGASAALIDRLLTKAEAAGTKPSVVDISADYRFSSNAAYAAVYKHDHGAQSRLSQFTCAVPEHLATSPTPHIGHPGCFATAILLASVPLLKLGIATPTLFISGVTGSTGAGRKPIEGTHHPQRHSDLYAYNALAHRHAPEVAAVAKAASGIDAHFAFVPHSGPLARGIHATVQAQLAKPASQAELLEAFQKFYAHSHFVSVSAAPPRVKEVAGSNYARLSVATDGKTVAVMSVLDNLNKGVAGGAVQWMNRLQGLPETAGLTAPAAGWT